MAKREFDFSAEDMRLLLGSEQAEDGDEARLCEFFFTPIVYKEITDSTRLKVLVAHKGVGKSTIFHYARSQEANGGEHLFVDKDEILCIDIPSEMPFGLQVTRWVAGLRGLFARMVCAHSLRVADAAMLDVLQAYITSANKPIQDLLSAQPPKDVEFPKALLHKLLDQFHEHLYVFYLDDLDYGWGHSSGSVNDIERLAALLEALRRLQSERDSYRLRVALRSDIYSLVTTAFVDAAKIRESVVWHGWTDHDLLAALAKRICTYNTNHLGISSLEWKRDENALRAMSAGQLSGYLTMLFEPRLSARGVWSTSKLHQVLLTFGRRRPRDLVLLIRLAAMKMRERIATAPPGAKNVKRITGDDILSAIRSYSEEIYRDTVIEYKGELPGIHRLLQAMRPTEEERSRKGDGFIFSTEELLNKLQFLIENNVFSDDGSSFGPIESQDSAATAVAKRSMSAEQLLQFLYKINFLVKRVPSPSGVVRVYPDEREFANLGMTIDLHDTWEIHPSYRFKLSTQPPAEICKRIDVSAESRTENHTDSG